MRIQNWKVRHLDKENAARIAEQTGVPLFLSMMLEARGFRTPEAVKAMLQNDEALPDPFLLPDMDKAAARLRRAIDSFERIAIYGDYDADGVTATALLFSYLQTCGANAMYYIPDREKEGYGMNLAAVEQLAENGVKLIITVDNGIASHQEIARAKELGMDVVVTDHHRPQETLPEALAVVDAWRQDVSCPCRNFSGVGVAFQLVAALEMEDGDPRSLLENYADLAAIGTIGDVVPLVGENRALVKAGLRLLQEPEREGIRALIREASMEGRTMNAVNVAFTLVPRINATGRMSHADRAVTLLVSEDPEEAQSLAQDICEYNDQRKKAEMEILRKVGEQLSREPDRLLDRVLVVEGEDWHHGVIGIVAARLVEKYGKPCIVLSLTGGEARGSGRSVEGFSLFEAVSACAPLLTRYGGHPMAAGMTLPLENVAQFRHRLNAFAAQQGEMPVPELTLDCRLNPATLQVKLCDMLAQLEPFGEGNPPPLFGLYNMTLMEITPVGEGRHLRLTLRKEDAVVRCMRFGVSPEEFPYEPGDVMDLAVTLDVREYRGEPTLSIVARECRPSHQDLLALLRQQRVYEAFRRGEELSAQERQALLPTRADFAEVYRFLRGNQGWKGPEEFLWLRLQKQELSMGRLLVILDVLEERGLLRKEEKGEDLLLELLPVKQKADLTASPVLRKLEEQRKKEGF
ncbi:MAG TPA: single-stranded-DNA-specific exonuclease RecJ [Firmicutes bacterium]|nr:single-stranded-DNA-specific exonuclease RecJ [Bacillota bacterium]